MGREVSRAMCARKRGTIIFTGATASVRGGKGFLHLLRVNMDCELWHNQWLVSWGRKAFMLGMSLLMAPLILSG